jgi:hypothetical protein
MKLFPVIDELPKDESEHQQVFVERCESAIQSYNSANRAIYANAPFIKKEFYELFCVLKEKCIKQINNYKMLKFEKIPLTGAYRECGDREQEISEELDEIISKVRDYLASLEAFD